MAGPTPLGALARGLLAGAAGTAVMTGAQLAYYRATGASPSTTPAQVARRLIEGLLQREVPEERTELLNNAMHALYGTSWGTAYGLVAGTVRPRALRGGLLFGLGVWGASLVELPALGLAPPVWDYSPSALAADVGFHLVYGAAVGAAYAALA